MPFVPPYLALAMAQTEPAPFDLAAVPSQFADDQELAPLADSQGRLKALQRRLWASRSPGLLIIFQGLDCSGKDGCIRQLLLTMDPMGYRAKGFAEPTALEQQHDFFWRSWPHLPQRGEVVVFNRSYYEAVMIESLLAETGQIPGFDRQARLDAIVAMERHLLVSGTAVLKFWLHLGKDEQRQRLLSRLDNPDKRWKFSASDLHNWQHRDQYQQFATSALAQTHRTDAPWYVVPADDKVLCRRAVCQRVADTLERLAGDYPDCDADLLADYRKKLSP